MQTDKSLLKDILKRYGYSFTMQRELIFDLLVGQEPQSMRTLCAKARGKMDRASVYRTVRAFEQCGIVQRVSIGWKYELELSDIFSHHHHHISCLECHKLVAIKEDSEVERLIQNLTDRYNFKNVSHQLEIQGYCEDCVAKIKKQHDKKSEVYGLSAVHIQPSA